MSRGRRGRMTDAERYAEDLEIARVVDENNAHSMRVYAVQEKLEALGIDIDDLIELIIERRSQTGR